MNWTDYAHQQIQRKQSERRSHEFRPQPFVLNLNRGSVFTNDESEVVAPHVSQADLATPVATRGYIPGFGRVESIESPAMRRLKSIKFPFTVQPE